MKTLEEIGAAFCVKVPPDSLVRITLQRGLEAEYDKTLRCVHVMPAKSLYLGMPQAVLMGRFKGCHRSGSGDGSLKFVNLGGYCFSLSINQIADYQLLKLEAPGFK